MQKLEVNPKHLRRSVAACAHIDDADGEQESMTLTVTKVRFQMIHQFLKNTSALAGARSSHENNQL